jgi:hypothetical protein
MDMRMEGNEVAENVGGLAREGGLVGVGRLARVGGWLRKGARLPHRALLAGGVALAAVAGVGAGALVLSSSSTASTVSASAPAQPSVSGLPATGQSGAPAANNHAASRKPHKKAHARELAAIRARMVHVARRAVDVEATVRTKNGFVTFSLVRGRLTSVTSSSIVVSEADGKTVSDSIDSSTKFFPKSLKGASGIVASENVVVLSKGEDALVVWVPSARAASAPKSPAS